MGVHLVFKAHGLLSDDRSDQWRRSQLFGVLARQISQISQLPGLKTTRFSSCTTHGEKPLQGYLAHKKPSPSRTLLKTHAYGPAVVLRGRRFLMSEVPLYHSCRGLNKHGSAAARRMGKSRYRGTSIIRKSAHLGPYSRNMTIRFSSSTAHGETPLGQGARAAHTAISISS